MPRILSSVLLVAGAISGASADRRGLVFSLEQTGLRAWGAKSADEHRAVADFAEDGEKSPVQRVVQLLGKMKDELMAEADKESAMYDKMSCWCETNQKEKTQAVAAAEARDAELSSETESRSARSGQLSTEIVALKEQIAVDTEALKQATALREKTASEFQAEEKDMVQAIDNLRNAIAVLAKHHGGSLLQLSAPLASGMRVLLRDVALKYELLLAAEPRRAGTSSGLLQTAAALRADAEGVHHTLLAELDQHHDALPLQFAERLVAQTARPGAGSFVQAKEHAPIDANYKSYSARSTQIYGILNQMLEEFTSQLSATQQEELRSIEDYKALAASKNKQIALAKEKLDDKEQEHADNLKALSDAKEDLELTRTQRSADTEFLRNLKLTCSNIDTEWARRSQTRAEELKAVTEAIAILTEDDNREVLHRSVSFLQERSNDEGSAMAARRARAVEALRHAAALPAFDADDLLAAWHGRRGSPSSSGAVQLEGPRSQLSTLALTAQLDNFEKVKEIMDKMLAELKDQQKAEVEFKAYCIKEFDENEKLTHSKTQRKGDLEAKLDSLATLVGRLEQEIQEAKTQIAAAEDEIKQAGANREAENAEFQMTVTDQRATQAILKKALARLHDFYTKGIGKKVIYLQRSAQTPPEQFTNYKANAGSTPVLGLLEQIIGDSEKLEAEATAAETKAQADYESFVKDSNGLIAGLSETVTTKTKAIADAKVDTAQTDGDLESTMTELESLKAYKADLHGQCDFVMKNFEIRQKARLQEMEAIRAAKAFLSGATA